MMEAIVLAGGFGTRLREVLPNLPKPMAPIGGKPFLEILLTSLSRKGFDRAILSLGFMAEKISGHFGNRFAGMEMTYVIEEHPLGTGGAVRLAISRSHKDHVFIFNGDTFLDLEANEIEEHWLKHRRPIVVGCNVPDTTRYGRLLITNGVVQGFNEKGVSGPGLINAGCYLFRKDQLDAWPVNTPFSLEADYLARVVTREPFDVFVTAGRFIDIGVPEDLGRAQTLLENTE